MSNNLHEQLIKCLAVPSEQQTFVNTIKQNKTPNNTAHDSVSVAAFKMCCRKIAFWNRKVRVELLCIHEHVLSSLD